MSPLFYIFFVFVVAIYCSYGQTVGENCIDELPAITEATQLILSHPSGLTPNYSSASSISYHIDSSTTLIAGDFFYIDPKNTSNRTYYSYFQGFDNKFQLKYNKYHKYSNPSHNKFLPNYLRSWTRIIAHPTNNYFYILGINNLTAYNIDGSFKWTAKIPVCSTKYPNEPLIYNDATFFESDPDNIYVAGSCVNDTAKRVIVIDLYNINTGLFDKTFRLRYNLTQLGFRKQINFGLIPPDVSIAKPVNESFISTSVVKKYFYVGFNHLMFSGIARIEQDDVSGLYRSHRISNSLINPTFMTHRSIVTTEIGLIALLDPSIISVLGSNSKHFIGYETTKELGQLKEKKIFDNHTWYGSHYKRNLHMDWTLTIDRNTYDTAFVTTAPIDLISKHRSTIAKHKTSNGDIIGGANVKFYALDSILTNNGEIVTVGFKWQPNITLLESGGPMNFSLDTLTERYAMMQVFSNTADPDSCAGCQKGWYNTTCKDKCNCELGYCNDDITGLGDCYCTMISYGKECKLCKCYDNLSIEEALCDSGSNGTGWCSLCFNVSIDTTSNLSISVGFSDKYGYNCSIPCKCNTANGVCYSKGIDGTGECLYCSNKDVFDSNCNTTCSCDSSTQYCSNGVSGTGCIDYDYGGLLNDYGWKFYLIVGLSLFIIFFTITWWQTQKHYKKEHNGKSMPLCPTLGDKDDDKDDKFLFKNDDKNINNNDLRQNILNDDPNEPPPQSGPVHSNINQNDNKYQI